VIWQLTRLAGVPAGTVTDRHFLGGLVPRDRLAWVHRRRVFIGNFLCGFANWTFEMKKGRLIREINSSFNRGMSSLG
jgi:hypothetical protein